MGRAGGLGGNEETGRLGSTLAMLIEGRAEGMEAGCPERAGLHLHSSPDSSQEAWVVLSEFQNHLRDHWSHSWGLGVGNHHLKVLPPPGRGVGGPGP